MTAYLWGRKEAQEDADAAALREQVPFVEAVIVEEYSDPDPCGYTSVEAEPVF